MKKIFLFLTAVFIIFATSGCVKYSYEIDIDKNNTLTFSETQAINKNAVNAMIQSMGGDENYDLESEFFKDFDSQKQEMEQEGYTVNKINDEKFLGVQKSKENVKFENLHMVMPKAFGIPEGLEMTTLKKSPWKTRHRINLTYDIKKAEENNPNTQSSEMQSYTTESSIEGASEMGNAINQIFEASPELKPIAELVIKIPAKSKVVRQNATKVINEREYQWDLAKEEIVEIQLCYDTYDFSIIIGVLGCILALGLLAFIYQKSKEDVHL